MGNRFFISRLAATGAFLSAGHAAMASSSNRTPNSADNTFDHESRYLLLRHCLPEERPHTTLQR